MLITINIADWITAGRLINSIWAERCFTAKRTTDQIAIYR
jgi:hypothetical protein